jgi:hypothetical protein
MAICKVKRKRMPILPKNLVTAIQSYGNKTQYLCANEKFCHMTSATSAPAFIFNNNLEILKNVNNIFADVTFSYVQKFFN